MGDKLANFLIVLIMIIIVVLGAMYYVKNVGNYSYSLGGSINFNEEIEGNAITANANTVSSSTSEENRATIGSVGDSSNIYVNQSGYKYNNRQYYNSLSDYSKAIYDAIANNIENLKQGNYRIDIDYDFNGLLNSTNGSNDLEDYYLDAINAINLDIPHLFYIDFSKMSLRIEKTSTLFNTTYKLFIDSDKLPNYFAEGFNTNADVNTALNQIETAKNQAKVGVTGSDYFKVRKLHDFLIDSMEYNSGSSQKATIYGALVEKKGVCESYARTYKYILDELGIENILVVGDATNSNKQTEAHMWNYVKLNDKWYAVDVTWDDPVIIGGGTLSETTKHKYFLMRKPRILPKSHRETYNFSKWKNILTSKIINR